ncbi:MAG: NTP transferase domain-containing protein [Furfurilactobacillus sp.]|jgi:CTP:phosphocholine cytidylyltransferase-like protein|uniref:NTP transferase domain-containing protein n=1 Tax=Furfurilactobacillus milii TaxID=2888272 RepID=A0ABT6D9P4_9LACO|nr:MULTISPECIES: NTP transferase domain-containing protein [Furfurilactobacillus]MCF6160754.1 NTP transferase domain-containing protein [Furfurilactobacillus milii]MCF6163052.1 NTP transferase domain-containing protein [Furfurilactobacillus milii]MCF6165353.1 NTP transferase domain-containing protein [Furfurilactobacillus rossiae]MCF6419761.1 NTP transferase domain-containing protein [Furfurilactobacillus milii]MCH4012665.1 NTP transferase domain-containing protein [Furfurilactobacillus sp.]
MNAIIMAAGLGSRFKEMTKNRPKSLLEINGTPNLVRTLRMLHDANINDIYIVVGYLHEQFEILQNQYPDLKELNLHFLYNDHFSDYNNVYSFACASKYFGDSFVIDADTVLRDNVFLYHPQKSTYYTILRTIHGVEWCPLTDSNGEVVKMSVTDDHVPSMSGISYWDKVTAQTILKALPKFSQTSQLLEKKGYWDDIPVALLNQISVTTHQVKDTSMYEMDTQENYRTIQKLLKEQV